MKTLKYILCIGMFALVLFSAIAQKRRVVLYQNGQVLHSIPASKIDSIKIETITDDEDPMNQAGILGKFTAEAVSLFDDSPLSWTCEIKKDYESGGLGVWVGPLFPDATYQAVYGTVSKDYTTITFDLAQSLNSDGSIVLDFLGASNVATCNNGTIQFVALGAMATGGGYYYAMAPVVLTKIDD